MARGDAARKPLLPGRGPLAGVSPVAAFVVVAGLFIAGVLVRGPVGALLLGLLALGVAALLAATWKVLTPTQRIGRVVVLAVVAAIAVSVL